MPGQASLPAFGTRLRVQRVAATGFAASQQPLGDGACFLSTVADAGAETERLENHMVKNHCAEMTVQGII